MLEGLGGDDMYTSNVYIGLVLAPSGSSFLYVPKPKMQQLLLAAMRYIGIGIMVKAVILKLSFSIIYE